MTALTGIAVSPGTVRGAVHIITPRTAPVTRVDDGTPAQEQFRRACRAAEAELRAAIHSLSVSDVSARQILSAHLALVADPMLASAVESYIAENRSDASAALEHAATAIEARFNALADPVMRQRAADLRDVCECIGRHLAGETVTARAAAEPRVVCAADLSPAQVIELAIPRPLAFVLEHGTETSHATILMRALDVPAVIRVTDATTLLKEGAFVVVDADRGEVLADSDVDRPLSSSRAPTVAATDPQPAVTSDGVPIAVTATIGDATDARRAIAAGADGIGLLRTEMSFLGNASLPTEEAQETFYREVAAAVGARPLTMRLLDLGADKRPTSLVLTAEENPALGLRGIRLLLAKPELLLPHLRALLRACPDRLRVLVPMVVDSSDVTRIRLLISDLLRSVPSSVTRVEVGAMVETPAAALSASEVVAAADFVSIGTNDLAQYVLAADRNCAHMAAFYQPLHPTVLRLVHDVAATAGRRGIAVSVCGELAADRRALPLLIGMGVTEFSVRPSAVANVKAQIRRIASAAAQALANEVISLPTAADVIARLERESVAQAGTDVREACNPR